MNSEYWGELKRCDGNEKGIGKFLTIQLKKSKYSFGRNEGFFSMLIFILTSSIILNFCETDFQVPKP